MILRNQAWATSPLDLNDPFDCCLSMSFGDATENDKEDFFRFSYHRQGLSANEITEQIEARRDNGWGIKDLIEQMEQNLRENIAPYKGIVCFSGNPEHILMWAHYANGHQGLCYQFDRKLLEEKDGFLKVEYKKDDHRPTVRDFMNSSKTDKFFLAPKSSIWAYEDEYRMVFGSKLKKQPRWASLPAAALTGIILGCRMKNSEKKMIEDLVFKRTKKGDSLIKTFHAQISSDYYKVIIPGVNT